MADRLYLSYWIHGFNAMTMLRHYQKALATFPYSKLRRSDSALRIYVLEFTEPPLLEVPVAYPVDPATVVEAAREFQNVDGCYEFECAWDLWTFDEEWKVAPARVAISCFGPEFANDTGEQIRIDFGLDTQFLPGEAGSEGLRMVQSNVRSLLRLVHDLDDRLEPDRRQLWSESGANFAELLESSLRSITG